MSTRLVSQSVRRQSVRRQSRPMPGQNGRHGWPGPDILVLFLLVILALVCAALGGLGLAAI